jgi:hypothetical protein
MTYLPDSVHKDFVSQWADPATADPVLLVRRVLEAPVSWRAVWYRPTRLSAPTLGVRAGDPLACLVSTDSPTARARVRLLNLAADARAHGVAIRRAHFRNGGPAPAWASSVLGTPPWLPAEGQRVIAELRAALIAELVNSSADQGLLSSAPAIFRSSCPS